MTRVLLTVIVHQGGIGTTAQALRAGKPMLVMPFGGDQYDNGARVERLRVGRTIRRKHYTAERVADKLKQMIDNPSYRERAADLGRRVQAEDGVACHVRCSRRAVEAKQPKNGYEHWLIPMDRRQKMS